MKRPTILAAGILALLVSTTPSQAQSKADFDALKKQVAALEKRLAERESQGDTATPAAEPSSALNKLKLTDSLTELRLSGDLRLRYQYDNRDEQLVTDSDNDNQRSRYRFRLRLNADFKLGENVFGGVQLVTGQDNDSDNATYENGFNDYGIFISRAYLGWNVTDALTIVAGKQPNPLYATELTWDADINPTGLSQSFKLHELFASEESVESYSKDGKGVVPKSVAPPWELTMNLGQFIFDDNSESAFDSDASTDSFLFVGQLVGSYKFSKDVKLTVAPGYMFFNAADASGVLNANGFSDVDGVSGETRKLAFITAPGDLSFKLGKLPAKFYWDFSWNPEGEERVNDIYNVVSTDPVTGRTSSEHSTQDDFAYLVGVQLGQNKKAGDWSVVANWRQTGLAGVDPNLNDSDFALSELNTRGFKVLATYSFTDFLTAGFSYAHAWNLRDDLFGGQTTSGASLADGNVIDVFQLDVNLKF